MRQVPKLFPYAFECRFRKGRTIPIAIPTPEEPSGVRNQGSSWMVDHPEVILRPPRARSCLAAR